MKAIIQSADAIMGGVSGRIEIAIDDFGPVMSFRSQPTKVGEEIIERTLTGDDAQMADTFIITDANLREWWNSAHDTNYVFEAGIDMNWDGTYNEKLFTTFSAAQAYAQELLDSDDLYVDEVYIHPKELNS
jgi:hypothetical protein